MNAKTQIFNIGIETVHIVNQTLSRIFELLDIIF